MAMTEKLKEVYTQNINDVQSFHTVEISHPNFSKVFYLVQDCENHDWELENTNVVTFEAFGFSINPPSKGSSAQELMFTFDAVAGNAFKELERAAQSIEIPIILKYRIYTSDEVTQQTDAITLELKNVTVTDKLITTTASRVNLFQKKVPKIKYDAYRFKGVSSG